MVSVVLWALAGAQCWAKELHPESRSLLLVEALGWGSAPDRPLVRLLGSALSAACFISTLSHLLYEPCMNECLLCSQLWLFSTPVFLRQVIGVLYERHPECEGHLALLYRGCNTWLVWPSVSLGSGEPLLVFLGLTTWLMSAVGLASFV